MKVMVALDESEGSFYALNWVLSNVLIPAASAAASTVGGGEEGEERESVVYVVHVHLPFQTYVYPAGPEVRTCVSPLLLSFIAAITPATSRRRSTKPLMAAVTRAALPKFVSPASWCLFVYSTTSVLESVREAQARISAAIFARALQSCQEKKIKAETLALRGDPKEMLCQAAEERHVDLLVVGSRGLGMLKRAFLGSVSDYCAHHARCPVLIVKPPKEFTEHQEQVTRSQRSV